MKKYSLFLFLFVLLTAFCSPILADETAPPVTGIDTLSEDEMPAAVESIQEDELTKSLDKESVDLSNRGYSQHFIDTYRTMRLRAVDKPVVKPNKVKTAVENFADGDWANTTEEFGHFEIKKH